MLYPDIDYDNHPNYQGLDDARLHSISESKFIPVYLDMQRRYLKACKKFNRPNSENYFGSQPRWPGIEAFAINNNDFRTLNDLSSPIYDELSARRQNGGALKFVDSSIKIKPEDHCDLYLSIDKSLENCGIFEKLKEITNLKWGIQKAVAQTHHKGLSANILKKANNDFEPSLPYLHIDSHIFRFKVIIYMTDVLNEEFGPFKYIANSQAALDPLELIIRKSIDITGIDGVNSMSSMALFKNLPKIFRKRANFGNDLYEGDNSTSFIKEQELVFAGPAGTTLLFNNDGFHRGGLLGDNTFRNIVQILLEPKAE